MQCPHHRHVHFASVFCFWFRQSPRALQRRPRAVHVWHQRCVLILIQSHAHTAPQRSPAPSSSRRSTTRPLIFPSIDHPPPHLSVDRPHRRLVYPCLWRIGVAVLVGLNSECVGRELMYPGGGSWCTLGGKSLGSQWGQWGVVAGINYYIIINQCEGEGETKSEGARPYRMHVVICLKFRLLLAVETNQATKLAILGSLEKFMARAEVLKQFVTRLRWCCPDGLDKRRG